MLNTTAISAKWSSPRPRLRLVDLSSTKEEEGETLTEQPEPSDQTKWMLAIRDHRDRASFGLLFDHYGPRLKGFLMRSGTSAAQAEDIVQDVMLAVWHRAEQFDPTRAQVSGWIYRIAKNRKIDMARKAGRPVPEELEYNQTETEDDPSDLLAVDQEASKLREALERLKPDQRLIVEKAYLGELSHTEIQNETGLPLGTIKSRIRLGLERLRHELKELRSS